MVAAGLLVSRAAQKCLLWKTGGASILSLPWIFLSIFAHIVLSLVSNAGLAGMSAQFCYLSLLQSLTEVICPVQVGDIQNANQIDQHLHFPPRSERGGAVDSSSLLCQSLQWARDAHTDLVLSLLTLLSAPLAPSAATSSPSTLNVSPCILLPFVTFVGQYLQAMFGKTSAKPKQEKV